MKKFLFVFLLIICSRVFASIDSEVSQAVARLGHGVDVGMQVSTLSGNIIYSHNPHALFATASTMKIYTAEAALVYLGPQYTFATNLYASPATVRQGILQGNVYLEYSGDPTLKINDLNALIATLKNRGIQQIHGNFYFDVSAYDQHDIPAGWNAADLNRCFSAPINAVIIDRNCKSSGTVKNPDLYSAAIVKILLQKNNITVTGKIVSGKVTSTLVLVASHHSAPLYKLIKTMLKKSDNVIAEALFKKLGEAYSHQPGSWKNGAAAVKAILYKHDHVDLSSAVFMDGSGLSHYNLTSAAQFVAVLRAAYYNQATNRYFVDALPVGGIDGTLKNRLKNYFTHGKVFAKTGTISGVNSLSGYIETKHHGILVFSIIVSGSHGSPAPYRAWLDKVLTEIAES